MQEIFKVIEGYEGLYEVSNLGRVRSLGMWVNARNSSKRFIEGRILKPGTNIYGYLQVDLCKDGKKKYCSIHRLVAEAFLPNPENLPCVNHINEIKSDNRVENLEWCTIRYNTLYSGNLDKARLKSIEKNSKKVQAFNKKGELVFEFSSTAEAGRNGFEHSNISACCNGKLKTHKGLIWKYA